MSDSTLLLLAVTLGLLGWLLIWWMISKFTSPRRPEPEYVPVDLGDAEYTFTWWAFGPFYWALETDFEGRLISLAWFRQNHEPWRHGVGIRLRLRGGRARQYGLCHKGKPWGARKIDADPEEIAKWR